MCPVYSQTFLKILVSYSGGDEHGSSSEKSFGKAPSSISPDLDDMLINQCVVTAGAGVNTAGVSLVGITSSVTSASNLPQPKPQIGHPTLMSLFGLTTKEGPTTRNRMSPSVSSSGIHDLVALDNCDSSIADSSQYSLLDDVGSDLSAMTLMDSGLHSDDTNTIKRSPHQHTSRTLIDSDDTCANAIPEKLSLPGEDSALSNKSSDIAGENCLISLEDTLVWHSAVQANTSSIDVLSESQETSQGTLYIAFVVFLCSCCDILKQRKYRKQSMKGSYR